VTLMACMQRISFLNKKFVEYYIDIGIYRKTNCFTTHVGTRITQNGLTRYYAVEFVTFGARIIKVTFR
jgi:hypothetical protein